MLLWDIATLKQSLGYVSTKPSPWSLWQVASQKCWFCYLPGDERAVSTNWVWVQCHWHQPWLGMVDIPSTVIFLGDGFCIVLPTWPWHPNLFGPWKPLQWNEVDVGDILRSQAPTLAVQSSGSFCASCLSWVPENICPNETVVHGGVRQTPKALWFVHRILKNPCSPCIWQTLTMDVFGGSNKIWASVGIDNILK